MRNLGFVTDWNYMGNHFSVILLFICWSLLTGCASGSSNTHTTLAAIEGGSPVDLKMKGAAGAITQVRYYSHSYVREFVGPQLTKEKDEVVDFTVEEKMKSVSKTGNLNYSLSTVKKDGIVPLHDLAFPEIHETINYHMTPKGKVLRAGTLPKWSVFYVPPIPLPAKPVVVGDTWEMSAEWRSMKSGIPMKLTLTGIHKNLYACGGYGACADIEVSGYVSVEGLSPKDVDFRSEVSGRILFSVEKGQVVWSMVKSLEWLHMAQGRTEVQSCLISRDEKAMEVEPTLTPLLSKKFECSPDGKGVVAIPSS